MNSKYENEEKKDKKKRFVFLLLLIILLMILLFGIVTCFMFIQNKKYGQNRGGIPVPGEKVNGGVGLVIDMNAENSPSYGNDNILNQDVVIAGRESIIIPANTKEVEVDFFNPKENAQLYYLTFELRLYNNSGEDYEILYTSGLVEPGKHINRITLSRELQKGVYEAVVHVQPYRMNEEKTLTNNADLIIKLIVK